ncbi:serine/threonine-protein kinase Sgk1 [Polymixia lowei]
MRNPKVSVEKAQGKGLLYQCPKCPLAEDLWYTHFPSPYGCCHYASPPGGQYYHQDQPSPCPASERNNNNGHEKSKGCKVRKWKMLTRHHGDGGSKQKEAESESQLGGCQSWGVRAMPLLASPVMLECCVCSGPYISYALEDTWQPRQRTQAMDLYYHSEPDPDSYCCPGDNTFMKQRRMGLNDFIQRLATNSYACKHPEVQSILNLSPPQDAELMNTNPSPPPSPSQQINLGPSSNPTAKPSDFHFLKVIGKGSFGKVLLARHRTDDQFYAVKVLQKKAILKKKEEKHIMSERNVLLKNVKHPFLVGLHYSFQTADKLYFILDYINGGEVSR